MTTWNSRISTVKGSKKFGSPRDSRKATPQPSLPLSPGVVRRLCVRIYVHIWCHTICHSDHYVWVLLSHTCYVISLYMTSKIRFESLVIVLKQNNGGKQCGIRSRRYEDCYRCKCIFLHTLVGSSWWSTFTKLWGGSNVSVSATSLRERWC